MHLSTTFTENKENLHAKCIKETEKMKTIPQCVNKVCQPLTVNQKVEKTETDAGMTSTRPVVSTKSPISGKTVKPAKRIGLSTIKQSISNRNNAAGKITIKGAPRRESKNQFEIFCEETEVKTKRDAKQPKPVFANTSTQTDFDEWLSLEETKKPNRLAEEALTLLRSGPSNEDYYRDIAEQRRQALEETLRENEELYDELDRMKQKCGELENALNEAESYKLLYLAMNEKARSNTSD